ncbi:MAG TPA: hypothetical protein DDW51_01315, partial [Cyanobacteria bacterium UBA11367]|nr:hypothetical protein [Cyanobacteria bacterium UBA11367]
VGSVAGFGMIYAGPVDKEASVPQPTITTIQQFTTGSKPQPRSLIQEPVAIRPPAVIQEPVAIGQLPTIKPQPAIATIPESAPGEGFPLSVLAGLAIGCGAGSFVVAQLVKKATQPYHPATIRKKTQKISQKQRPVAKKTSAAPSNSTLSSPHHQQRYYQPPVIEKQQTQVTVVSASENHPLDKREETLAEMLDLRKRKSLSSLMREE